MKKSVVGEPSTGQRIWAKTYTKIRLMALIRGEPATHTLEWMVNRIIELSDKNVRDYIEKGIAASLAHEEA